MGNYLSTTKEILTSSEENSVALSDKGDEVPWAWLKAIRHILTTTDDRPSEEPSMSTPIEILPWLFISSQSGLRNTDHLQKLGVTHVLTTNAMSNHQLGSLRATIQDDAGIAHRAISAEDEEGYRMIPRHWVECRGFLSAVRRDGGKVVVHCVAGQNRSALIVSAALVSIERMPLCEAVTKLKARRGTVLTNRSFQRQLCVLASAEGLLGERPDGYTDDPIVEEFTPKREYRSAFDKL